MTNAAIRIAHALKQCGLTEHEICDLWNDVAAEIKLSNRPARAKKLRAQPSKANQTTTRKRHKMMKSCAEETVDCSDDIKPTTSRQPKDVVPVFKFKCKTCGTEVLSTSDVTVCDACGSDEIAKFNEADVTCPDVPMPVFTSHHDKEKKHNSYANLVLLFIKLLALGFTIGTIIAICRALFG